MRFTLLCILLGCVALGAQNKPANLTGDWVFVVTFFDNDNYTRVALKQEADKLTGGVGNQTMTGTVHDGQIELTSSIGTVFNAAVQNGEIVGTGKRKNGDAVKLRAYREKPKPAQSEAHVFEPTEFQRYFSSKIPPVLHIYPGDSVKTWSVDAGGFDPKGVRRSLGGNPETGPFYIEGALPGDTLVVHLLKVRLNRDTAISSGRISGNAVAPWYQSNMKYPEKYESDWKLDREKGIAMLEKPTEELKNYTVPLRPMLGCIGVAPPGRMTYLSGFLGDFGGNMDYNRMREGVTVYLPVFEPGALLFMGDGHAAQGDGELTGNALETSMDIEFSVDIIRGRGAPGVRAEDNDDRMAMGIAGSLNEALQQATTNMARWLEQDYKLNPSQIASVLGTAMHYDIAEVVDPEYHVVARVSKQALSTLKKQ